MSPPPLQVCTTGELLYPGATAGVVKTAPIQLALANKSSERVTCRKESEWLVLRRSLLQNLPERTAFTGYSAGSENSACIEAGGELIAQLNAAQAHKMCSFLIQKAKAGWLILIAAYTFGLPDLVE